MAGGSGERREVDVQELRVVLNAEAGVRHKERDVTRPPRQLVLEGGDTLLDLQADESVDQLLLAAASQVANPVQERLVGPRADQAIDVTAADLRVSSRTESFAHTRYESSLP